MTQIRTSYQNLIGGVSQQPEAVRSDMQCERQDDGYVSVVDGLGKRQPTQHVYRIQNTDAGLLNEPFVHWIDRDASERYVLLADHNEHYWDPGSTKPDPLYIYEPDYVNAQGQQVGRAVTITGPGGAAVSESVLDYMKPRDGTEAEKLDWRRHLRALTIADSTFILNRQVKVKMEEALDPSGASTGENVKSDPLWVDGKQLKRSARRYFLFQRFASASSTYGVRLHTKIDQDDKNWDPFRTDTVAPFTATRDFWLAASVGLCRTFDGNFDGSQEINGVRWFGRDENVPPFNPGADKRLGAQNGTLQSQTVLEFLWGNPSLGTFGASGAAKYGVDTGSNTYEEKIFPGGILATYNRAKHFSQPLEDLLRLMSGTTRPPILDGVLKLELRNDRKRADPEFREVILAEIADRGDDVKSLVAFSQEVQNLDDLPLTCEHGHVVHITGADEEADGYYVEFVLDEIDDKDAHKKDPKAFYSRIHNMGKGHWKESMASGSEYKIDPKTMPLELKRVAANRFEIDHAKWADKVVGDEDSDPKPAFVDNTIDDLFLWRNRLGFLSNRHVILSEANEFSNFWRTSVQQVLDSDTIDLDAGHDGLRVADLHAATPLEDDLILWSDRAQFRLEAEPTLTPRTAALAAKTHFDAYPALRPETVESNVFFAFPTGGGAYSHVYAYHRSGDTEDSYDAMRTSEQVPRYIKGEVLEMTATARESVLAVRATDEAFAIYVNKWHDRGRDRLLSSWMRFRLGPETTTRVLGMKFIGDELYMLTERTANAGNYPYSIEKIVFSGTRQVDVDSKYKTLLDRRVDETQVTFARSTDDRSWEVSLPYHLQDTDVSGTLEETIFILRNNLLAVLPSNEGQQFEFTHETVDPGGGGPKTSKLVILDEDSTLLPGNPKFYVGQTYRFEYEFSRPTLKVRGDNQGVSQVRTGRFQVLRGTLTYEDSGYMIVKVAPALHADGNTAIIDIPTHEYPMPNIELGMGNTLLGNANIRDGVIRFGVYSQPQYIRLLLENPTPYPSNPKGLELESSYTRTSRMSSL